MPRFALLAMFILSLAGPAAADAAPVGSAAIAAGLEAGTIPRQRVELAARVGLRAAREALGQVVDAPAPRDVPALVEALGRAEPRLAVLAATEALRAARWAVVPAPLARPFPWDGPPPVLRDDARLDGVVRAATILSLLACAAHDRPLGDLRPLEHAQTVWSVLGGGDFGGFDRPRVSPRADRLVRAVIEAALARWVVDGWPR